MVIALNLYIALGNIKIFFKKNLYECFAYMCVYTTHACLVPTELRRGHRIPWNRKYKELLVTMWLLEIEL